MMKIKLRKEHTGYRLTWAARLLILLFFVVGFVALFFSLYRFLAPNDPSEKGLLVVEGWIYDDALAEAVEIFKTGAYTEFICTGIPIETGSYLQEFHTYSEMTAARLRELGVPRNKIRVYSADSVKKDRTYQSAVALKEGLTRDQIEESQLYLITTGPHGRRSRMLFKKALGPDYDVAITCLPEMTYSPDQWYRCSEGVRSVMSEVIAYAYAKLFFHP